MIKEEITSVLNEDHSKRSSYLNEYVVEDEKNLISTTVNESGEIKENLNAINCQVSFTYYKKKKIINNFHLQVNYY